jgi:outer membrane protein assembly factor BamB
MARIALGCVILAVLSLSRLNAEVTTVKSGTVEAVSEANQTITVKFAHADHATELKVPTDTPVRMDGAASELTALKPGMSVTVQVGADGQAQRIIAHSAKDRPASTSTTTAKSPKPKTTSHKPAKSKATKTTSKTHSKKKSESEASPLDSIPVMTTPLAGLKNPESKSSPISTGAKGSWPCFLGPNHNNVSQETGLLPRWPPQGPSLAWHTPGLGQGFSTVSISDGIIFSMGTPEGQESLLAIGLNDGKALWSVPTGGPVFQEASGNGPRSTPTVDGGRVYALGASGDLICVDIKSKAVRWRKNLPQEFAASVLQYGFSESVLIDGQKLICTPGGQAATIAALDKDTGAVLWKSQVPTQPSAAYASPIVADVGGTRQYIDLLSRGVVGVKATDGQFLWGNDAVANANAICSTPLFIKDHVFVSASYGAGAALIHLAPGEQGATQANLVFHSREMKNHHGGMVAVGSFVYGADDQILTCFSLETGRAVWKNRSVGKCSLTCADGRLYVRGEQGGAMALVEATPSGYHELGRFIPPKSNTLPAWPYPVVAGGRLFLRDQDDLLCYSLRGNQ